MPLDGVEALAGELAGEGRTVVDVALDGRAAGLIALADAPRETAAAAITGLKELGISPVMLTGDTVRPPIASRPRSASAESAPTRAFTPRPWT